MRAQLSFILLSLAVIQCCNNGWSCFTLLFTGNIRGELLAINTDPTISTDISCDLHGTLTSGNCTGGRARQETYVNAVRANNNASTLLVDCGGSYFGSLFYFIFNGAASALLMNRAQYDVLGLMIEDFYPSSDIVANYLLSLKAPIVCSNLNMSTSVLLGPVPILQYQVANVNVSINGVNTTRLVGFVGAIDTSLHSSTKAEPAIIVNPISTTDSQIRLAVRALQLDHPDCNIIVLVSSVRDFDQLVFIAQNVYELDVILMAEDTRVINYTDPNSIYAASLPVSAYKNIIGNNVVLMNAIAKGEAISHLDVVFDENGNLQSWNGFQRYLTQDVAFQPTAQAIIANEYNQAINATSKVAGTTEIQLNADSGDKTNRLGFPNTINRFGDRWSDSTGGRFVADTLLWYCPDCDFSIINGGAVRTSVPIGPVNINQLMSLAPFGETVTTFTLRGDHLIQTMLDCISIGGGQGRIPQVSGMRYAYNPDPSIDVSTRLLQVQIYDKVLQTWADIKPTKTYKISSTDYTFDGFDGYVSFLDYGQNSFRSVLLIDALTQYLQANSPITGPTEAELRSTCEFAAVPFGDNNKDTACRVIVSYLTTDSLAQLLQGSSTSFIWQYVVFGPLVAVVAFVLCVALRYWRQRHFYAREKQKDLDFADMTPLTNTGTPPTGTSNTTTTTTSSQGTGSDDGINLASLKDG